MMLLTIAEILVPYITMMCRSITSFPFRFLGIGVLHDITQHDYPSYNGSYDRSRATVQQYLKKYPSIRVVLDIHRDAIASGDTVTAPVAEINGKTAAQIMIISGCDSGKGNYPEFRKNLRFASALQNRLESDHPGLTRPVLFDYRFYNQDLTTGYPVNCLGD